MKAILILSMVGCLGGLIGGASRIPGGVLVGAMIAVIFYKAFGKTDYTVPRLYMFLVQVMVGIMVGAGYSHKTGEMIHQLIWPVLASTLVLVGAGLVMGIVFSRILPFDPITGYLATSPGAMSSLIPLATEAEALPSVVAAFHFFRLVFILVTAPLILKLFHFFASRGG